MRVCEVSCRWCLDLHLIRLLLGLARTVNINRIWPWIWWFPCQKHRIYTVYIWFWPTLVINVQWKMLSTLQPLAHVRSFSKIYTASVDKSCLRWMQWVAMSWHPEGCKQQRLCSHMHASSHTSTRAQAISHTQSNTHTHTHTHLYTHTNHMHTHTTRTHTNMHSTQTHIHSNSAGNQCLFVHLWGGSKGCCLRAKRGGGSTGVPAAPVRPANQVKICSILQQGSTLSSRSCPYLCGQQYKSYIYKRIAPGLTRSSPYRTLHEF